MGNCISRGALALIVNKVQARIGSTVTARAALARHTTEVMNLNAARGRTALRRPALL